MLENEQFTYSGEHAHVDGAYNNPRPTQSPRPPLWVGGGGEKKTLRIVAKYADWHNLVVTPLSEFKRKMEILDEHCADLGRDPRTLGRSLNPSLLIRESDDDFDRYAAERAAKRDITVDAYMGMLESQGTIFGGPERVSSMIREFADGGCSYFEFIIRESDHREPLTLFAEKVMPRFQPAAPAAR
jgi:alkanesulfonate monooxygenase SsuD/methylene tetrahydromethanopterin reductase-like flavin-dependent oxidoreductase (luciferase family)